MSLLTTTALAAPTAQMQYPTYEGPETQGHGTCSISILRQSPIFMRVMFTITSPQGDLTHLDVYTLEAKNKDALVFEKKNPPEIWGKNNMQGLMRMSFETGRANTLTFQYIKLMTIMGNDQRLLQNSVMPIYECPTLALIRR
ncbi:MAG: hypothetical protein AB7N80_09480 [Bdellovibrionales bacterium]